MESLHVIDCTGSRCVIEKGSIIAYRHPVCKEPFVAQVDSLSAYEKFGMDISYSYIELCVTVIYDYNTSNIIHNPGEKISLSLDPNVYTDIKLGKRLNLLVLDKNFFKEKLNEHSLNQIV